MSKFQFSGHAEIGHLNTRKEGPDEDKVLAVDLKLQAEMGVEVLAMFFPDPYVVENFLFMASGAVRNAHLGALTFDHEIEDYRLIAVGSTHFGVKVKKFSLTPKDERRLTVGFSVSFKPSGDEVARMAEYLQDLIEITVAPSSDELDLSPSAQFDKLAEMVTKDGGSATITGMGLEIGMGNDLDPMFEDAVSIVRETGKPSISLVQRHLRIGYNRAARLVEQMEKDGIVSAMDTSGARAVL